MADITLDIKSTPIGDFASSKISTLTEDPVSKSADNAVDGLEAGATASVNEITTLMENTMQQLLNNGSNSVLGALGINEDSIQMAQTIVNAASNITSAVSTIISIMPTGMTTVPSEKNPMSILTASLKEIGMEQLNSLKQVYDEGKNAVMLIHDNYQEILMESAVLIIDKVIELCDNECYKWTGYHIIEIYYMCEKGFQLIKQLFRRKPQNEDEFASSGSTSSVSVDKEQLKEELKEWLKQQSDAIYNAFIMISIKDMVQDVKDTFTKFTNTDITLLANNIDNLDEFVDFLDKLGINSDKKGLTLTDVISQGLNAVLVTANALNTMASNAQDLATIDSAVGAATAVKNSTTVSKSQTYEMKSEVMDDYTKVTITLYADPNTHSIKKKISKTFENIQVDKVNVFDTSSIIELQNYMDNVYNGVAADEYLTLVGKKNGFPTYYKIYVEVKQPDTSTNAIDASTQTIDTKSKDDDSLEVVVDDETKERNTFEILNTIITALKPILPILKQIGTLVSNYKINKAKVQAHAHADAAIAIMKVMTNVMGMSKSVSTKENNFYTIRTSRLYNRLKSSSIEMNIDKDGMLHLNRDDTSTLIEILKELKIDSGSLSENKETTAYIDNYAIDNPQLKLTDGSTSRLDNITPVPDKDTVLYTENNRSVYASQIMLALSKGLDWTN